MLPALSAAAALLMLLVRALALGAEAGISATSTETLKERGATPDTVAAFERLKSRPDATFAALRSLLVLSLCLAAAFGALASLEWLGPLLARWLRPEAANALALLAGGLATSIVATPFDLAAHALAAINPPAVAARFTRAVTLATALASPSLNLFAAALDLVVRPMGGTTRFGPPKPPLEDIERLLVEEARRQNIDPQGPKLIRNIFEMSEKTARDVMVPRTEVVALDIATSTPEILRRLAENGYSRTPVYRGHIDKIVGILHTRDLVPMLQHPELIVVEDVLRPAHYIPWSKPVGEILREMQKKRIHMALVVDEYGGFAGIVTLEDVLEVIVGDIQDEYDEDSPEIEPAPDGAFLVRATISLDAFGRAFSVEIPEGPYETLGGFLSSLAGAIPEANDTFFLGGLQFTITDRSPRRVRRVKVQRVATPPAGARKHAEPTAGAAPRPEAPRGPASPGGSASSGT